MIKLLPAPHHTRLSRLDVADGPIERLLNALDVLQIFRPADKSTHERDDVGRPLFLLLADQVTHASS